MSFNRENVVWHSATTGLWNAGFYVVEPSYSSYDEDYDSEWDVDYDFNRFGSVSVGHPTSASAELFVHGAGGGSVLDENASVEARNRFDLMAQFCLNPALEKAHLEKVTQEKLVTHFAQLTAEAEKAYWFVGAKVTVTVGADEETVASGLGMFTTVSGSLVVEGDWVTVDGVKVWRNDTKEFARNIKSIRQNVTSRSRVMW